jgi:hypothetical protein
MFRLQIVELTETRAYISHHAPISWTKNSFEGKIIDLSSRKIERVHLLDEYETKLNSSSQK